MSDGKQSDDTAKAIMAKFGKAFFAKDRKGLAEILTEDAEWHFAIGPDAPHGRVRVGVDGFLLGIEENGQLFSKLRFEDIVYRWASEDEILMTYRLDGQHRDGDSFNLRGVELITVRDGRICKKDVFWKQYGKGGG